MHLFQIQSNGESQLQDIAKTAVAKRFDMHTRDLRPVFLSHQLFTISVRGEGIIVNLGKIKMIIGTSELYLFQMKNEKRMRKFIEILSQKLKTKKEEDKSIPFEFLVLETAFTFILEKIAGHYENFEKRLEKLLEVISDTPSQENFEKLLLKKKEISRLEKSAQEIQNALNEVLDDEEELEDIWISKKKNSEFEEEDVESILENLLEQVVEISHKIDEKKENIDDTQEIITLKLSSIRNTIIHYDLLLSAFGVIVGIGTLISGFYGMNVLNPHTNTPSTDAFFSIIGGVILASFLLFFFFFRLLKKKKIWG